MRKRFTMFCFIILASATGVRLIASGQGNGSAGKAIRVFMDCGFCDMDYIRKEINFVNYVIDRKTADVHILVTRQTTGSGGNEYTLTFLGQEAVSFRNDTLVYSTNPDDTDDASRSRMVQYLKLGLVRYAAQSPVGPTLAISYEGAEDAIVKHDKWNNWVFGIQVSGQFEGEKSYRSNQFQTSFTADRITDAWKIRAKLYGDMNKKRFEFGDDEEEEAKVTFNTQKSREAECLIVRSVSNRWSIGVEGEAKSSTYSNIRSTYVLKPALEFDVFPYSQSTRREFRILYQIGGRNNQYEEATLYDKLSETLYDESLEITLALKQPWGNVETQVSGSHYLHDAKKYHLKIDCEISWRLFKGMSFTVEGDYSKIHDQLSLRRGEASVEDVLLRRRELSTQFNYNFSIGLEYSFGSIYNNIVNPRFGNED